jgi:hypothetical protein
MVGSKHEGIAKVNEKEISILAENKDNVQKGGGCWYKHR